MWAIFRTHRYYNITSCINHEVHRDIKLFTIIQFSNISGCYRYTMFCLRPTMWKTSCNSSGYTYRPYTTVVWLHSSSFGLVFEVDCSEVNLPTGTTTAFEWFCSNAKPIFHIPIQWIGFVCIPVTVVYINILTDGKISKLMNRFGTRRELEFMMVHVSSNIFRLNQACEVYNKICRSNFILFRTFFS